MSYAELVLTIMLLIPLYGSWVSPPLLHVPSIFLQQCFAFCFLLCTCVVPNYFKSLWCHW